MYPVHVLCKHNARVFQMAHVLCKHNARMFQTAHVKHMLDMFHTGMDDRSDVIVNTPISSLNCACFEMLFRRFCYEKY